MAENFQIEYKRQYTKDSRKEIVAFANTAGGTLYIGIEDDGTVCGVDDGDAVLLQVVSMIRDAIKPEISMFTQCTVEKREGKNVVVVSVQRGTNRPYYIGEKGLKPSGVYVRVGSASVPASDSQIRSMIKETDGDTYEDMRSLNQTLNFSFAEREFASRNIPFGETQMINMGLIGNDGLYTNLGLLLSDECLHTTKVAVFQGKGKSIFRDRKEFSGSLLKQLADSFEFISLNNKTQASFDKLHRVDVLDYPEVAIRETLLNAYVHRDYSFSGSTLVNIYTDRIEIISLGGLIPGLSLEAVTHGASQSRNVKLANVFFRLKLIEAFGTGITKAIKSYEGQAVAPSFEAPEGAFIVELPNINESISVGKSDTTASKDTSEDDRNIRILEYLKEHDTITRAEVEQLLEVGRSSAGYILKRLENDRKITMVRSGRSISYKLAARE